MALARYVVDAVVLEGRGVRQVARAHGVSKSWVSVLVARYVPGSSTSGSAGGTKGSGSGSASPAWTFASSPGTGRCSGTSRSTPRAPISRAVCRVAILVGVRVSHDDPRHHKGVGGALLTLSTPAPLRTEWAA